MDLLNTVYHYSSSSCVFCTPYRDNRNIRTLLQNTIKKVMGLMVIMGIVLVLMETIMVSTGM